VLFTSLVYYQSARLLQNLTAQFGCGNSSDYQHKADLIQQNIYRLWDSNASLFNAATIDCRQHDVWGSLFAVSLGLVESDDVAPLLAQIVANASGIFQNGQVRQLIFPELWQRCIVGCPAPGTYQVREIVCCLLIWAEWWLLGNAAGLDPARPGLQWLCRHGLVTVQCHCLIVPGVWHNGVFVCGAARSSHPAGVNFGYHGVVDYVASATATYSAGKQLGFSLGWQ
jgi:hypothetical protein